MRRAELPRRPGESIPLKSLERWLVEAGRGCRMGPPPQPTVSGPFGFCGQPPDPRSPPPPRSSLESAQVVAVLVAVLSDELVAASSELVQSSSSAMPDRPRPLRLGCKAKASRWTRFIRRHGTGRDGTRAERRREGRGLQDYDDGAGGREGRSGPKVKVGAAWKPIIRWIVG